MNLSNLLKLMHAQPWPPQTIKDIERQIVIEKKVRLIRVNEEVFCLFLGTEAGEAYTRDQMKNWLLEHAPVAIAGNLLNEAEFLNNGDTLEFARE